MEPDCYVEHVPKLSVLAADVITRFPSLMSELGPSTGGVARCSTYSLRRDLVALPLPVSEALLNSFRRNHGRQSIFLTPKILGLFSDATKTPLLTLDVEGSFVNDRTLATLLTSHGHNLLCINLSGCAELTEELNELSRRSAPMLRLRILNLGNLVKLFTPWLGKGENNDDGENNDGDDNDNDGDTWKTLVEAMDGAVARMAGLNSQEIDALEEEFAMDDSCTDVKGQDQDHEASSNAQERMEIVTETDAGTSALSRNQLPSDEEDRPSSSGAESEWPVAFPEDWREASESAATGWSAKNRRDGPTCKERKFILTWSCPNLLALILHGENWEDLFPDATADVVADFFLCLLHNAKRLLYLDLSYWSKMGDLRFLRPQRCLQTLILFDVPDLYHAVLVICSLSSLRHLDISQSSRDTGQYPCPVTTLNMFVTSLPRLTSLDITSTNLASNPTKGDFLKQKTNFVESDIVGLRSLRKPLEYLGIFYCDIAAHYHRIPAKKVIGDANETQILLAIEQYMKRPALLLKVLNEAYQIYRFGTPARYSVALQLMLESMANHVEDASIQIAASASIFYIIRNVNMAPATKKRVVNALLTGMEEHLAEQTMVRNCCLSLCQFEVPGDLLFDYTRAARLLLRVIDEFQDQMTQRIVVYLLNSMACHVEGEQKVAVGDLNAVERILNVIRRRHDADLCDEVMEVAWSFLWNITDETPTNCDRFLRSDGMELFYECYKKFPEKNELLRNMMGLMGNIAEVKTMRRHLMQAEYVSVFCELLKNLNDGIEISYNSAGVLSHMLSDGPSAWEAVDPSRQEATQAVIAAIETWQLNARRFINYRSFEPILRLVPLSDCSASQHWSVWALANLTTVDGSKYCPYIIHEGGVPLLEKVLSDDRPSQTIRKLAALVLDNVWAWATEKGVNPKVVTRFPV